jgi:nanoRNase/pAp phosphatase (c-di-AMP/oligoRNAs hydrolase)
MDLVQQIISKISQVSNVLIVASGNNGDSLAAGLALRSFLAKLEKEVTLLSFTPVSERFHFLPDVSHVTAKIDLTKSFVIDVSTKKAKLSELSYKKEPELLSIFIKPQSGEFKPEDVSFRVSNFPFELIILLGVPDLSMLGEFYNQNASLFFETPIVNIDYRATNENYGQFNLIDLSSTSCSEIILDLINKFEAGLIDESIATQLLTGIITETNSFQHVRTTPQTFLKASQLVTLGARQQDIVSNLYKSKSLGLLKLWGRVLARLKQDFDNLLVYSAVNQSDIAKSEATAEDANSIIKEMVTQLNFAKIFLFLKEEPQPDPANPSAHNTTVFCHTFLPLNLMGIFNTFHPTQLNLQSVKFTVPETLAATETKILEILKTQVTRFKANT